MESKEIFESNLVISVTSFQVYIYYLSKHCVCISTAKSVKKFFVLVATSQEK